MTRTKHRLTTLGVRTAKDGVHSDGGNLHLRVGNGGRSRKWVLRYARDGKVVEIGLGGADRVSLKMARELRDRHMEALAKGLDPRAEKRKARAADQTRKTFGEAAVEVIAARRQKWRANANDGRTSSLDDWTKHLTVDCKSIADRYVGEIDTDDVERIVRRYWDNGFRHSAYRLLTRIRMTFDYAKAKKWRTGDNPAAWTLFETILQADAPPGHEGQHPALDWSKAPAFMAALRASEQSMAALALEMMILTGARSGEARGMRWDEIAFDSATWTVPAERMKRKIEHKAPLSTDAVALLRRLDAARIGKFVFPGRSNAKPIAHWAVWDLVQRLTGREAGEPSLASPHGFRASLRSWMADRGVEFELAEACLAHAVGNATSRAYNRTDLLERRRPIMQDWASFLAGRADAGNVVPMMRSA